VPIPTEQEVDSVLGMYSAHRQQEQLDRLNAQAEKYRQAKEELLRGKARYACGPCRICVTNILAERAKENCERLQR
jgi:hypothetical protein